MEAETCLQLYMFDSRFMLYGIVLMGLSHARGLK
jgi:hypothetical protein